MIMGEERREREREREGERERERERERQTERERERGSTAPSIRERSPLGRLIRTLSYICFFELHFNCLK